MTTEVDPTQPVEVVKKHSSELQAVHSNCSTQDLGHHCVLMMYEGLPLFVSPIPQFKIH